MISAWWDFINRREGWSARIGKLPLIIIQFGFIFVISFPITLVVSWFFDGTPNWTRAFLFPTFAMAPAFLMLTAPFRHWDEDQKKINEAA